MQTFRFRRSLLIVVAAVFAGTLAAGCGKNPLVGKWTTTTRGVSQVMEFKPDGGWSANLGNGRAVFTGTYKAENGNVTISQDSGTLNGVNLPMTTQMKAPHTVSYTVNGDTMTMTQSGRQVQFARSQ